MDQYHLDHYTEELTKAEKHHSAGLSLMKFAMVVTLILYGLFTVHLYLGNGLSWGEYFKTINGTIWFFTMLAVAALLSIFLAWVKHFAYTHFSKFAPVISVTFTVIAFALFAEFFSSSANQDAKSHAILNTDNAYQATIKQQSPTITTNSQLASDIAKAEQRLARCYENLKHGKEKHCRGDKAKVESLKQSQKASGDMQVQASVAMQSMNYARQDKLKADSHNPTIVSVAKLLSGLLGGNYADYIKVATLLVMILVAAAFEKLHHFLSRALRESDFAVQHNKRKIAELYDQHNGGVSKFDVKDQQENNSFGFVPATAQKENSNAPRFKYQDQSIVSKKQPIGFVNTDNNYLSPDDNYHVPTPEETARGKQTNTTVGTNGFCSPKCESESNQKASTLERQDELNLNDSKKGLDGGIKGLNHKKGSTQLKPFNSESNQQYKKDQETNQKNDLSASTFSDYESLHSDPLKEYFSDTDVIYPSWKKAVRNSQCELTVKPCRNWVKKHLGAHTSKQVKNVTDSYAGTIVGLLYQRGLSDKVIVRNPNWKGAGRISKYILA